MPGAARFDCFINTAGSVTYRDGCKEPPIKKHGPFRGHVRSAIVICRSETLGVTHVHETTDVETTVYETMRHETLNEIGREKAIGDFLRWLDNLGP